MSARLFFPTEIQYGKDAANAVGDLALRYGDKALLVTSRQLFQGTDIIEKILNLLQSKNIHVLVYDSISPESDSREVDQIAELARAARCEVVVALGGDVVLDMAKAVALLVSNPGEASDYLTEQDGYRLKISRAPVPTILLPTAFGTLAEVATGFVLRDSADGVRKKLYNAVVRPTLAIYDPALTMWVSRRFVPVSGIWMLALAIELMLSSDANLVSDAYLQRSIEILNVLLPVLHQEPDAYDTRSQLLQSSMLLAMSASTSKLGPIYAVGEAFASRTNLAKVSAGALLLPHLMEFNLTAAPARFVQLVKFLGEDVRDISVLEAAIKAVERVRVALEEYNLPTRLSELGLDRALIPSLAPVFFRYDEALNNPRAIQEDDLRIILEQAM